MSDIDQGLVDAYKLLLIKQYFSKPKAAAEIESIASAFSRNYTFIKAFGPEFDLDLATGDRLDKIGKLVGVPRIVPFALPKIAFGFDGDPNSRGFASKFDPSRSSAPFQSKFEPGYTDYQLNDADYRFFIKAKIAVNSAAAIMVSDDRISIQDVITTAFEGLAYVVDNYDMSLTLYISPSFDLDRIQLIKQLKLLPKPQGVQYKLIIQADPLDTFGFANNPTSKGFASKFNPAYGGGIMARKVI